MRYPSVLFALTLSVGAPLIAAAQYAPVSHIATNTDSVAADYDPSTHRAYIAGFEWWSGRTVLTEVDGVNGALSSVLETDLYVIDVAVNPVTHRVYLPGTDNFGQSLLQVVDAPTGTTAAIIPLELSPRFVAVNAVTDRVYVEGTTVNGVPSIAVLDAATNEIVETFETDTDPAAMAVNPVTNRIFLAGYQWWYNTLWLTIIDGDTNTVIDHLETNTYANSMAVNPATNRVYVGGYDDTGATKVTVVDAAANAVMGAVHTDVQPVDIAVSPLHDRVFVAGITNPDNLRVLAVIDSSSNTVSQVLPIDSDPISLHVDDGLDRVYINGYRQPDNDRTLLVIELEKGEIFPFSGFFAPVDAPPVVNSVRAGAAVPVKFSLGGDRGLDIFAAGFPRARLTACAASEASDDIEETVSADGISFSYDPGTGQYTYVWKTDRAWAGSCRELQVGLVDGQTYTARFALR